MGKYKEHPKYNVISMRISAEEKNAIEQMKQHTQKSISGLIREAMQLYAKSEGVSTHPGTTF